MTALSDLPKAEFLGTQLTEVTQAIAAVQAGGVVIALVISDPSSNPAGAGRTISGLNLSPPGLLTALQARQTSLNNQLSALGVTVA